MIRLEQSENPRPYGFTGNRKGAGFLVEHGQTETEYRGME